MTPPDSATPRARFFSETLLPTRQGEFLVKVYRDSLTGTEPSAIIEGEVGGGEGVPVRIHSECFTGEVLGSLKCDCREQLEYALDYIKSQGRGVVIYLRQEGRGIGLGNKIAAYALQEEGMDTVDANRALGFPDDIREYGAAAEILRDLGIRSVRLLTNNPNKSQQLESMGIPVLGRIPVLVATNPLSHSYLQAKRRRMGHLLHEPPSPAEEEEERAVPRPLLLRSAGLGRNS